MKDVLCVPNLTTNLLSVSQLISKGNRIHFTRNSCQIYNCENKLLGTANLIDGIYKFNLKNERCRLSVSGETWHRRIAHINSQDLNKMKDCINGLMFNGKVNINTNNCVVCCESKQSKLPFPNSST